MMALKVLVSRKVMTVDRIAKEKKDVALRVAEIATWE